MTVIEKNYYRREGQKIPWLFARCREDVALKEFNSWEFHEVCKEAYLEQQQKGCVARL